MKKKLYKNEEVLWRIFSPEKSPPKILFAPRNYHSIKVTTHSKVLYRIFSSEKSKKYLIFAWKLLVNEGNYALKIDGGRQKDRKTEIQTDGQSLL